jgi:hypothetical protein
MAFIGRSDVAGAVSLLSSTATYRVEGSHSLAGLFPADQIEEHLRAMIRRTSGTLDATKFDDWLIGDHYVGCVVEIKVQAARRRYSGHAVFLFKFDRDDLINKVNVFFEDAEAASRFLGE